MTDVQQAVPVAQEDRDLFALLCPDMAALIYGGDLDAFRQMQGIARHRLASLPCSATSDEDVQKSQANRNCKSGEGAAPTNLNPSDADCKHSSGEGAEAIAPKPAEVGGLLDMTKADVAREGSYSSTMVRAGLLLDILNELYAHRERANAALDATQTQEAELVAALEEVVRHAENRIKDGIEMRASAWRIGLEEIARDARAALNALSCRASDQAIESPNAALNARGGCAQPAISEQNPLGALSSSGDPA